MMNNNSEQERIELRLEVDYIANGAFYTGFTKYLSPAGLFITTTEITTPGEIIFIDMYLPNYRHKLKLKGRVLRALEYPSDDTPPGMEVEFIELKEHLKDVIAQFLTNVKNGVDI
jgi:Tfp pilus assembly protein PilZ